MTTKSGKTSMDSQDEVVQVGKRQVANGEFKADLDRLGEILRGMPMLRRYGGDAEALKEAGELVEKLRKQANEI